jgi:hypothetical protein
VWLKMTRDPETVLCDLADGFQCVLIDGDHSRRLLLSSDSMNKIGSGFVEPLVDSVVILGQGPER